MAAKGKVLSFGCSIVCSKIRSNFRWFLNLKWREKVLQWCLTKRGKPFFLWALGKRLFPKGKASKPFRELANYVSKQMR